MTTLKWATEMCEHRRAKPRDDSGVLVATAVERLVSHVKRAPLPSLVPPAISAGMTCVAPDAALAARRVKATLVGGIAVLLWALLALFTTRSEEHTSELQSLLRISYAVFCLKKKTNKTTKPNTQ